MDAVIIGHRLVLPFPPSVNSIWKWTKRTVIRDPAYSAWLRTCDGCVYEQIARPRQTIKGKYDLCVTLDSSRFGFVDQDNCLKATSDFLQRAALIENDKNAWHTELRWEPVRFFGGVPGCLVEVRAIDGASP